MWIPSVFNAPCFLSIKLSLLFFYRRLFLVNQKWLKVFWWLNLVYAILWAIGSGFFYIFQCQPVDFYWLRLYETLGVEPSGGIQITGECPGTSKVAIPLIFNLFSDIALLLLPTVALSKLKSSIRKKIGLLALFSLGLL